MTGPITVFQRTEKKYFLCPQQRRPLMQMLLKHLQPDDHGLQTIANIYYDTPDFSLIRESLEKPIYKEKLRVRSYGRAEKDDQVYVELKKKFKGVVYKRREAMCLKDAEYFLRTGAAPEPLTQILKEIRWFRAFHFVVPKAFVAYEREAYFDPCGSGLRVTFDTYIRCRDRDLSLFRPLDGTQILRDDEILMEIKSGGAIPLWLADALCCLGIYPVSFSKYGYYYREFLSDKAAGDGRQFYVA